MAELADAPALGAGAFGVGVQIPLSAPKKSTSFIYRLVDFYFVYLLKLVD